MKRSQGSAKTLRWLVAGSGVVLLAVVAGFIAAGRLRMIRWPKDLPGKLGAGIQQDANGFTWDQSVKGRHLYTVHASKEVRRSNGTIGLHDVGIVLYDADGKPANRIHGQDFEYNQKQELLTAHGEVFLDLVPPDPKDPAANPLTPEQREARLVHVKTIGLVFDQKGQLAESDGAVEFQSGGFTGNAVGVSFNTKDGVVVLRSAVRISGLRNDRPMVLIANRAEMERKLNRIDLVNPHFASTGDSGTETAVATHALVFTTPDGSPKMVNADGNVRVTSDGRGTVVSDRLDLDLGPKGQAQAAHMYGNVRYDEEGDGKKTHGQAADARVAFDAEGRPVHALFGGGVEFDDHAATSEHRLNAATMDLTLGGGGKQPTVVRAGEASGPEGAKLSLVSETTKGKSTTQISADRLLGQFATTGRTTELTGLDGVGKSLVIRTLTGSAGRVLAKDTSAGATLHADFKPGAKGRSELTRAEQRGNVTTVHEALRKNAAVGAAPTVEHGRADDAVYEVADDLVHLSGSVEVQDETSALFADRVDVDHGAEESVANGNVRVSYIQQPKPGSKPAAPQEPVYVVAARANGHQATGRAEFFGDAATKARMWQGSSQVQAPVLEFYQKEKRLVAHGAAASDAASVLAVLANAGGKQQRGGAARVTSREMVYRDSDRTATFTGLVRLVDQDGTLTAQTATVWLKPEGAAATGASPTGFPGGQIDHSVATGNVVLAQPGRTATGEKLVYTADDGNFFLTGTKGAPPRVADRQQGTTTGAALRFRSGDDSVEILGSEDGKSGRVRSETRVRQ
jgi:lipopolysaccharide export system protein LptA